MESLFMRRLSRRNVQDGIAIPQTTMEGMVVSHVIDGAENCLINSTTKNCCS